MVIGSVLLQPRKVASAAPPRASLLEDVLALVMRLLWDQAHGGVCLSLIEKAFAIVLQNLRDGMKSRETAALQKLTAWAQPFVSRTAGLGHSLPGSSVRHDTLQGGAALIDWIVDLLDGITTDELAKHMDFVLRVMQDDLGLTNTVIDQQVTATFDEIVKQLRSATPEADIAVRENRLEMVALIRRFRRQIEGKFTLPPINVDRLAAPLLGRLRSLKYDDVLSRVGNVGKSIRSGLNAAEAISDAIPFEKGFSGGMGAAAAPNGGKGHAWYASWVTGKEISAADPTTVPDLSAFSFKHVPIADLEKVTLHATWITTLIDGILVGVTGLKRGNYAITILSMLRDAVYTILAPAADVNLPTLIDPGDLKPQFFDKIYNVVMTLLCSLEGRSLNSFDALLYFFRFLFKFGGTSLPVDKLRDLILSIITLANHDPSVTPTPENRHNDGLIQFCMQILGPLLHAGVMPDDYFSINGEYVSLLAAVFAGALGISVLTFFTGMFISAGIAGALPDAGTAAQKWAKGWGLSHLNFIGFWFIFADGATDGGKRGYTPGGGRGTKVAFDGYPDNSASPYLLPYEKDAECVQGNHGFWSHNSVLAVPQNFAYDFSLNLGQEILCMRDGEVVSVVDNIDDGDHSQDGNHIVIRHTTANASHDKDVNGAATTTYATYYHGKKGSIAEAFGGTVPAPGTHVQQGKVIMKCNSTGMSGFNHIHIHVMSDNGGSPNNYSIPFVFKDAGDKGVPKSRTVYDSANVKIP